MVLKITIICAVTLFNLMIRINATAAAAAVEEKRVSISHTFTNKTGTYDVRAIMEWASKQPIESRVEVPTKSLADFLIWDTWSEPGQPTQSNLRQFVDDVSHNDRILRADLSHPIVLTNDNVIIDGVHRLVKATYDGLEMVKCLFIDRSTLVKFRTSEAEEGADKKSTSIITDLPIPDRLLRVAKSSLPEGERERRDLLEEYFSEQLPTAIDKGDHWDICLERPSTPYGCYILDPRIREGLEWWKPGTRIRDIPAERRVLSKGMFALEDQWTPLSWSIWFQKNGHMPRELVLLHVDDHQDMMSPRIGERLDQQHIDLISGDHFSLLKPETVEAAILSGAVGKGSILTPLIWEVDKLHLRHLTLRPTPYVYAIKRALQQDMVLGHPLQRISAQCERTERESLLSSSNYVPTSKVDDWLGHLPDGVPILLHVDMDFFNNRFDGSSSWQDAGRCHDISLAEQQAILREIFAGLKARGLEKRIVDVSICLSPSFFPAEFWQPMYDLILEECRKLDII
jgi:hypothetical protein